MNAKQNTLVFLCIGQAHERVRRTLGERRVTPEDLARLLLKQEVVDRAVLEALLRGSGEASVGTAEATRRTRAAA